MKSVLFFDRNDLRIFAQKKRATKKSLKLIQGFDALHPKFIYDLIHKYRVRSVSFGLS